MQGKNSGITSFYSNSIKQNGWEEIILRDDNTGFQATVIPSAGAILNKLEVRHIGRSKGDGEVMLNIIDGFKDKVDFLENNTNGGFKSAKLSPFVCRLKNATFTWEGQKYIVKKFVDSSNHALHGVLYDCPFEVLEVKASFMCAECKLLYKYIGNYLGYPFPFDMSVHYRLEGGCRLSIITTVHNRSDGTIPISDGWHPYFKLGDTIDNLSLQIRSRKMLEFNEELIPTGKVIHTDEWLQGASLNNVFLDNSFVLAEETEEQPHCCALQNDSIGLSLLINPDTGAYPYLQVYTPPHRESIAIENLSSAPNAFNNEIGLIKLKPNTSKEFRTCYQVVKTENIKEESAPR